VGAASSALADDSEVPDDATQVQTTETPDQQRAREQAEDDLRMAIGRAKLRLHPDGPCRTFFGASTTTYPGQDAFAVLTNLRIDGKVVNALDRPGPMAENGPAPAPFDPNTGTIIVYTEFFDTSAENQIERDRKPFDPPPSPEDFQVLILLDELAHVFGRDHESTGDSPRKFNDELAMACFNSSLPPAPQSPPGAGGFDFGDGAIDSPSYTVPEIIFVDPLPDGEGDVTIGEITDWDIDPDAPEPLPDDVSPDDPCALEPPGLRRLRLAQRLLRWRLPRRWFQRLRPVRRRVLRRWRRPLRRLRPPRVRALARPESRAAGSPAGKCREGVVTSAVTTNVCARHAGQDRPSRRPPP
jgi:hypothetical protein